VQYLYSVLHLFQAGGCNFRGHKKLDEIFGRKDRESEKRKIQ
jgi:hypothetical protein